MNLDHTKKTYEKLGREDPFYAVLTVPKFRNNGWDRGEFFATGDAEIREILRYIRDLDLHPLPQRALDFGCGVGRLTQALAQHFEHVVGVDIAQSMVAKALELNNHGDRVEYVVNSVDHLRIFADASFDFIYSSITLQHIPPDANRNYVAEFMRLLSPGGIAVFQVPNGKAYNPGSLGERWYRLRRQHLRRFWKALRGKPQYEMHYIPRAEVESIISKGGAKMVDVQTFGRGGPNDNYRYCVAKLR